MCQGRSAIDRPLANKRLSTRRPALPTALVLLPLSDAVFLHPGFSSRARAERWVQISRLPIGEVVRGIRDAASRCTKPNGSGVGLTVCRQIVETRGGRLGTQLRQEGATAVSCSLPPERRRAP